MRIIKPKKSSGSVSYEEVESGDLPYTVEELPLDGIQPGSIAASKKSTTGRKKTRRAKSNRSAQAQVKNSSQAVGQAQAFIQAQAVNIIQADASDDVSEAPQSLQEQAAESASKKEFNYLFSKGIKLLSMREHSIDEITKKLSTKSDSIDLVLAVIDYLLENNYLSNERFAESFVRSKTNRGFGPTKIKSELKSKGITNSLIQDHLDASSAVWYENARNQYQKKYGDGAITDYNTWAKRARFMQSRGFTMEHIQVTMPRVEYD